MDKTSGVQLDYTETLTPAAVVRASDLEAERVEPRELTGAVVVMNGAEWECVNYKLKPSPAGESGGEVYLFLRNRARR